MANGAMLLAAALAHLCTGVIAAPALAQPQLPLAAAGALEQHPLADTPPSPPPITGQKKAAQSRKLHGRFLHITDFHPDEFYKVHTSTAQGRACHSGKGPAGTYGAETSDCDAPISLVNATFDWIVSSKLRDEIDFVIWTGDSARHDSDEDIPRSPAQVLGTNRLLANKFAETFSGDNGASVPVIPNFGNNDILPHNVLMPGPNKWLKYYADIWRHFIPEEQRHSFEFGGWFYVEVIPNKLAVFSLNTLYFFDRNAGVDDCVKPSEPGFKHMEWLRVQLQFMRDRGMKAILMGHVPPARTDSKMLWDETCWQKYTLWLKQYRDVVISGLYGHMNIDHFVLMDTNEIDIRPAGLESQFESDSESESADEDVDEDEDEEVTVRENLDDELSVQSATDYLEELREGWAKLSKPSAPKSLDFESEKSKNKKKKKKGKKGKKGKDKDKLDNKWAERYHLALISPSIVPNYFPTLRVFEYNITGLEDAVTWADYTKKLPTVRPKDDADETSGVELELRDLDDHLEIEKKKKHKKKPKKPKGDKNKKKKKGKKPKDPNLVVPDPPSKSSLPGPAYSPQPLTLTGYTQYYANLTYINNDIAPQSEDIDAEKWRKGKHGNKTPKNKKPKPREFQFDVEYTTYDDKLYNLTDLTVRSFVELAYRMGKTAKAKTAELLLPGGDIVDDLDDLDVEELEGHELDEHRHDMSESNDEETSDETEVRDDVEAEKKKKKGKKDKKKKKKKKGKKPNKTWLHFLRHAFVSTVDDDELKDKFS